MEFKRGKTFIKSSMQLTQDKLPLVGLNPREKTNIGAIIKDRSPPEIETSKASSPIDKSDSISNTTTKTGSDESILLLTESFYKPVRKSKTHDCVLGAVSKTEQCSFHNNSSEEGSAAPGRMKGRLINSASFSGLGNVQNSSGKKESVVNSSHFLNSPQQMIDYRNFVPQMPFVPAVAKSIPRKRISLKRSKKGLRDIFHIKKNKPESLAILSEKQKRLPFPGCKSELAGKFGKYFFKAGETFNADCLAQDFSDGEFLSESSYEYSSALCEDVASLKSFDSLTGCGEIFADESSAHMELEVSKEILLRQSQKKENPAMGSFQGGVEQLASPAQSEAADFAKLWDNINKSVQLHQKTLFDRRLLKIPTGELGKARSETSASVTDLLSSPDSSKESSIDTGTPKSDNQESMSTSDEGYYDSFSPGQDDELREDQSPGVPGRFPRDSYSGDALYELFCDPNEAQTSPVLDDDLCISESISEKATDIPLSIYSFHVGSEEKMASQPAVDIISQGFLHSTWKGKECLLKLCDTELSLTMGIINWLRNNPGLISPQDLPKNPQPQLKKAGQPVSSSPSNTHQKMYKAGLEENKTKSETSLVNVNNGIQSYSVEGNEKSQSDILSYSSPQESSQEREGTLSGMSTLITDNSISYSTQRSEESWDDLLSSSEIEKISLLEECTDPTTETLSLEVLNLETICQTDENALITDNHDAESCSSYMTAATSPDSLENGELENNESKDQSWPIECDRPTEPLTFSYSQSCISQTPKENGTDIMQLLEHCVNQVASLKINCDSENKDLDDKCTGSEVSNHSDTLAQFEQQLLLQNECSCVTPLVHISDQGNIKANVGYNVPSLMNLGGDLIYVADQKNSTILDCMGSVAKNKLSFEYAQLNNQALSYIKDFRFEHCTQNSTDMTKICRPTFLPLLSSICSDTGGGFSQSFCIRGGSMEKLSEDQKGGTPSCTYPKFPCKLLPQVATLPLSEDATKEKAVVEKNHEIAF